MRILNLAIIVVCFIGFLWMGSLNGIKAVEPEEQLADPELEARARNLSLDLRCLVCQNQSIDDSDADLAKDLRVLLRERLLAGDTDKEVKEYLVERYGQYILLKPPFGLSTLLLWGAPFIFLAMAMGVYGYWRRMEKQRLSLNDDEMEDEEIQAFLTKRKEHD